VEEIRTLLDTDSATAGDPMSERKWTHQTAGKVAQSLAAGLGIKVSATVVRRLLGELDYSLKSNKKCLSSGNSPDRDKQFGVIKRLREEFVETGEPIISVDTKKKELIGLFKNPGRTIRRKHKKVNDHDFRSQALGLASPYGIYDGQRNFGVLVVGESADTPEFAVNSILTWWTKHGRYDYPNAKRMLILADGGGSNGVQPRMWKKFLQERFADEHGITITVAHYPAGASKWNPIEHRMFSEISKNWAGVPLESFDTVVNFARKTTTETGLHIAAYRDERVYEKGKTISDEEMDELALTRADELGRWNYTIQPRVPGGSTPSEPASNALPKKHESSPILSTRAPTSDANSVRRRSKSRHVQSGQAKSTADTPPQLPSRTTQERNEKHASTPTDKTLTFVPPANEETAALLQPVSASRTSQDAAPTSFVHWLVGRKMADSSDAQRWSTGTPHDSSTWSRNLLHLLVSARTLFFAQAQ
jgi:hypothetical protein